MRQRLVKRETGEGNSQGLCCPRNGKQVWANRLIRTGFRMIVQSSHCGLQKWTHGKAVRQALQARIPALAGTSTEVHRVGKCCGWRIDGRIATPEMLSLTSCLFASSCFHPQHFLKFKLPTGNLGNIRENLDETATPYCRHFMCGHFTLSC